MKIRILLCFQLLLLILTFKTAESTNIVRIQAAYWGIKPIKQAEEQLHLLKTHGFNTALVKDGNYLVREDLWQKWGHLAEKQGILLFPVLNFAGKQEIKNLYKKYPPYTDRYGRVFDRTPCPLDRMYWNLAIKERWAQLARLSTSTALIGIIFDTEMYGGDLSIYSDHCFCDSCWNTFLQTITASMPDVPREERFRYLSQHALLEHFNSFQEEQLQKILESIEHEIHRINPHLPLGFLAYQNNWFYKGLIQGIGTNVNPVMVFSETTYIHGYTPYLTHEQVLIKEKVPSGHARYIPGLWLGRFFPDDLPSQLYALAIHADGYWIFTADSLWSNGQSTGDYALHAEKEDYWKAIKKANDELLEFSRNPDTYQSSLPQVYLSSFYSTAHNRLVTQPSLKYFLHHIASGYKSHGQKFSKSSQVKIRYRGKVLLHGFREVEDGRSDRAETISITHIPLGQYIDETHYILFDEQGTPIWKDTLSRQNRSVNITLPPHISGLISLLVNSGANAAHVIFANMPFIIEASSTFPLSTINTAQTYAFSLKPGQERVKLRTYCSTGETALLSVQSPDNNVIEQYALVDWGDIHVTLPISPQNKTTASSDSQSSFKMNEKFWEIVVGPIPSKTFEDVQFYFYDEEFPYLLVGEYYQ